MCITYPPISKKIEFSHFSAKFINFLPIFVSFTFFWFNLRFFTSHLFLPLCIYASCFIPIGRPSISVREVPSQMVYQTFKIFGLPRHKLLWLVYKQLTVKTEYGHYLEQRFRKCVPRNPKFRGVSTKVRLRHFY